MASVSSGRGITLVLVVLLVALGMLTGSFSGARADCDVSVGSWVLDKAYKALYDPKNCSLFLCNRRRSYTFLKYQWKSPGCDLQRMDPGALLTALRGKTIGFVGDSLSGNLANAVTCAFSAVSPVKAMEPMPGYPLKLITTYRVPAYDVTVMRILSPFYVALGTVNGTKVLDLNTPDPMWTAFLGQMDYIVFGGMHWFFHPDALYHMGAQYVQSLSNLDAITAASLTVRDYILSKAYRGVPIMVTYSPVHMQGIYPPADGRINCAAFKTPASESQLEHMAKVSESIAIRDSQVAAFRFTRFKLMDITRLSLFRPDGHSGAAAGVPYRSRADCSHWCVPGVPDTWADILYSTIMNKM